jgi:hypothetical protein
VLFDAPRFGRRGLLGCALLAFAGVPWAQGLPALDEVVMYEANLRAMSAAGDLAGVIDRLDEIEALGVNTLWLMPIHPVGEERRAGELGSPYSVRDHLAVGVEYGTIDDLRALIDAAHARGISVLLDWVANHTAWDHPWIATHPEWYTTDAQGTIVHPPGTNWLDVADLDYSEPAMRAAMIGQMVWWVTNTEIDGFRIDAPDFVPFDFWAEALPAVRAGAERPLLLLAEGARADHFDAGFDLTFGWRFFSGLRHAFVDGWGAGQIAVAHGEESAPIPPGKRVLRWTTNHDETAYDAPPPVLFGGLDASLAAYASMVVYGDTPLIYSGQEVGSTDLTQIFFRDPIDWTTNPGLPAWYSWIIGVRQAHAAIRLGSVTDRSTPDALVVARTLGDERVAAWIGVTGEAGAAPVPAAWAAGWTNLLTGQSARLEGAVTLPGYGIGLYRLDAWPTFVISGALQTEQGDPADWDPVNSSLVFGRDGGVYTARARGLGAGVAYPFEIITDRGEPPVGAGDPRVATGLLAVGDADGAVTITLDDTRTNNKGGPEVWVDTDSAPLQAVGNFMDEAGGASDWDPADPAFRMTPLGGGRYVFDTTLSAAGGYAFKSSFGAGWGDQVGTDGSSDDARVLGFSTARAGERVRLFVDLRARRLEAWVGACGLDRNGDQRLDLFDVLDLLRGIDAGEPGADYNGDGSVDQFDAHAFIGAFAAGCG